MDMGQDIVLIPQGYGKSCVKTKLMNVESSYGKNYVLRVKRRICFLKFGMEFKITSAESVLK